jgi:DNA polymerase (family 10)
MNTEEIAKALKITAQLMELHEENPFKIKSIANAAYRLDKTDVDLENKSLQDMEKIEGIGKGIAAKIHELQTTGNLKELQSMMEITPVGVIEMLSIKGIGPKKVRQLWKELDIESVGELLYACNENRLITLKGFGAKTQAEVKKQIEFFLNNVGKFHYATVEQYALELVEIFKKKYSTDLVSLTGAIRRKSEIIEEIEILIATENKIPEEELQNSKNVKVLIYNCSEKDFYKRLFETTGSKEFLIEEFNLADNLKNEEEIFSSNKMQYIEPELRENASIINLARENKIPKLIEYTDLRGVLHNHSTYSDGLNTLKEMAVYCKELGYEYLGICDHSQSAFYAEGLKPEKVLEQHREIDLLNKELFPFKIFKGIESDILNDGSLDYEEDILKSFDFIVASVHSNLKMDEEKATQRLLKAIENPYTTILGHPTGRLLLSRPGYPINHKKIIDACAANNVIIELNAHPYRLDIDWRWIPYCLEKGVKISINPDAHEKSGYLDMYYGTCAARKGMLTKEMCFNTLSLSEIELYFKNRLIA